MTILAYDAIGLIYYTWKKNGKINTVNDFSFKGKIKGKIGKYNVIKIKTCTKNWCSIKYENSSGWINKINIWGTYPEEEFNIPFYQSLINQYWTVLIWLGR